MFPQWFTVSMLRSHLQRQIWLCETTTPRVPDAAVAILITHVALEATTDLPQITIRGVTNWHAMMTTTMKLQIGQLVSQVSVSLYFWIICIFPATYCPEPESLETEEIRFHSYSTNTARLEMQTLTHSKRIQFLFWIWSLIQNPSSGSGQDRILVHSRVSEGCNRLN